MNQKVKVQEMKLMKRMRVISVVFILFTNFSFSQEIQYCKIDLRKVSSLGKNQDAFKLLRKSRKIKKREIFLICDRDTFNVVNLVDDVSLLNYSNIDLYFNFRGINIRIEDIKKYICSNNTEIIFFFNTNNLNNERIMFTTNSFSNSSCGHVIRTYAEDLKADYHLLYFNNK